MRPLHYGNICTVPLVAVLVRFHCIWISKGQNCLSFIVSGPWTMVVPWNWNLDPGLWSCCGTGIWTLVYGGAVELESGPWTMVVLWNWNLDPGLWSCCGTGIWTLDYGRAVELESGPWTMVVLWNWNLDPGLWSCCGTGIWTLDYGRAVELESGPWTMVVLWNWNLDPGLWSCCGTGIWILDCPRWRRRFIFVRHPNKKCNNDARSRPGSNHYVIIVPPPNSTTWTGHWRGLAHTVLRSWTSLFYGGAVDRCGRHLVLRGTF